MSAATAVTRVLPRDVFDTLELSALAFGGIGAGTWNVGVGSGPAGQEPWCAVGLLAFATGETPIRVRFKGADGALLFDEGDSDRAVMTIRRRQGLESGRVPFADWCRELGVIRGRR